MPAWTCSTTAEAGIHGYIFLHKCHNLNFSNPSVLPDPLPPDWHADTPDCCSPIPTPPPTLWRLESRGQRPPSPISTTSLPRLLFCVVLNNILVARAVSSLVPQARTRLHCICTTLNARVCRCAIRDLSLLSHLHVKTHTYTQTHRCERSRSLMSLWRSHDKSLHLHMTSHIISMFR